MERVYRLRQHVKEQIEIHEVELILIMPMTITKTSTTFKPARGQQGASCIAQDMSARLHPFSLPIMNHRKFSLSSLHPPHPLTK